jgi:hypothetical protein
MDTSKTPERIDRDRRRPLYWLTNTEISSARFYWDNAYNPTGGFFDPRGIKIPVAVSGIVTLTNASRAKSRTQSRSCRSGDFAPCLHGRGSECPVRLC